MYKLSRIALLLAVLGACSRDATSPNGTLPQSAALASDGSDVGAVFTLSNSAAGNAVIAFARSADGTLTPAGTFATQGNGTGAGLGSQGAVALSSDGQFLFAVNAASNTITSFTADGTSLTRVSTVPSGGTLPISLTTHGSLVMFSMPVAPRTSLGSPSGRLEPSPCSLDRRGRSAAPASARRRSASIRQASGSS